MGRARAFSALGWVQGSNECIVNSRSLNMLSKYFSPKRKRFARCRHNKHWSQWECQKWVIGSSPIQGSNLEVSDGLTLEQACRAERNEWRTVWGLLHVCQHRYLPSGTIWRCPRIPRRPQRTQETGQNAKWAMPGVRSECKLRCLMAVVRVLGLCQRCAVGSD